MIGAIRRCIFLLALLNWTAALRLAAFAPGTRCPAV